MPGFSRIVPKAYGDLDQSKYDLFLVLDSGATTMISKKTEVIFPESMTVINIDHHQSNPSYGRINLIDTSAPSLA
jgi:nanoRNase/pAp phosphatase (c-di-AMP/oligoRNAs hydrolase)